ncbi:MAG: NDP-sugar synthase [Chloroflexi bacterium]|nr:NDP-sugar synthase [Chloroflexota bacterium]
MLTGGLTAVVLAGGEGTRLRPLTNELPKPVLPVANRPFFEYMLDHLKEAGVTRVIMALGYRAEPLIESFGNGSAYGLRIDYEVEDRPLGTSGAVRALLPELKETFLVLNGDCVTEIDIAAMVEQHVERREYATLAVHTVDDPSRYGVVVIDGIGYVSRFIEKPPGPRFPANTVNSGVYALEPEMFNFISDGFTMFEKDLFPTALMAGVEIGTFPWEGYFMDMGTPASFLQLNRDVLTGIAPTRRALSEPATAPIIEESARLDGPVNCGNGVTIGANARIIGPVVLGDGVVISDSALIEESVILAGAHINTGATIRGAIVAQNAVVSDGATVEPGSVFDGDAAATADATSV